MFHQFGAGELLLVLALLVLLFGAKRLPEVARGLGRSMRILKSEVNALHEEPTPAPAQLQSSTSSQA